MLEFSASGFAGEGEGRTAACENSSLRFFAFVKGCGGVPPAVAPFSPIINFLSAHFAFSFVLASPNSFVGQARLDSARATGGVCEKIAQNVAQYIFVNILTVEKVAKYVFYFFNKKLPKVTNYV
jgi:hypothetical protein